MLRRLALLVGIALLAAFAASAESNADRFAVAGITEAEARSMFVALQDGVRSSDPVKLAALIEYPLRVNSSSTHSLISDPDQFAADFSNIFTSAVRQQVLAQQFDQLFVNWRGVMVGDGAVWFSGICDADAPAGACRNARVRIIGINLTSSR